MGNRAGKTVPLAPPVLGIVSASIENSLFTRYKGIITTNKLLTKSFYLLLETYKNVLLEYLQYIFNKKTLKLRATT